MIENLHDSLVNNFCQYAELFFSAKESFLLPAASLLCYNKA